MASSITTPEQQQAQKLLPHKQVPKNIVTDLASRLPKDYFAALRTRVTFFQVGKSLRFGIHGITGILAFIATARALVNETEGNVLAAVVLGAITAIYASFLLGQVPPASSVAPGIVAPHIDAFKAAIALIFYLDIRCLEPYFAHQIIYTSLVVAAWWQFVPSQIDWYNGNTYLLVLPRFFAVSFDMINILVTGKSFPKHDLLSVQMFLLVFSFLYSLSFRVKHKSMPVIIYFVTTLGGVCLVLGIVMPEVFRVLG